MMDLRSNFWTEQERSIGSVDESTADNLLEVYNEMQPNAFAEPVAVLWPSRSEPKQDSPIQLLSKGGQESVPDEHIEEKNTPKVLKQSNRGIVRPKRNQDKDLENQPI
jgi:hypothetical protein